MVQQGPDRHTWLDPVSVGRYPSMDIIFYTAQHVSEMTGLGVDWIWRQARENKIPHHKLGGRYRWTAEDITSLTAQTAVAQNEERA